MQQSSQNWDLSSNFLSFLTFADTFSHIIHRFKDFCPFHSLWTQIPIEKSRDGTRKSGWDETGRVSRHNTTKNNNQVPPLNRWFALVLVRYMEFETFRFVMVQYFRYFYMMSYDYDTCSLIFNTNALMFLILVFWSHFGGNYCIKITK